MRSNNIIPTPHTRAHSCYNNVHVLLALPVSPLTTRAYTQICVIGFSLSLPLTRSLSFCLVGNCISDIFVFVFNKNHFFALRSKGNLEKIATRIINTLRVCLYDIR